jgi:mRNA-degrading endonuclease HigB of HigAB toxin-antitoxin module
MDVIGASLLSDYGAKHPQALPFLRALYALLASAQWARPADVERECGAIIRFMDDNRVILEAAEPACEVVFGIHYGLGVVRILAVTKRNEGENR